MGKMLDPYLFPDSEVLKNKLNIKEKDRLQIVEAEYTSLRISAIAEENTIKGDFGFEHLCQMHYYIFQDIYEWAGQSRIINIEKAEPVLGGLSIEYTGFQDIKLMASSALSKMKTANWDKMMLNKRAETFSKCMAELWKVHPFREGNTRTVVTFCCQYTESKGFDLDTELFAKISAYVRNALVAASAIFKDIGDKSNPQYLIKIVKDALERGKAAEKTIPRDRIFKKKRKMDRGFDR